jgi:hypothetical protein
MARSTAARFAHHQLLPRCLHLPHELNPLALTSRRPLLDLLFEASSQTLLEVATDPQRLGSEIGFLSILHTCGSNLLPHYHVDSVVPGGGLSADHQRWIHTSHPMFLLPVPVLRTVFREKFLSGLRHLYRKGLLNLRGPAAPLRDPAPFDQLIRKLGNKKWHIYAKPPFGGPEHVLRYLGCYTQSAPPACSSHVCPSVYTQHPEQPQYYLQVHPKRSDRTACVHPSTRYHHDQRKTAL